MLETQPYARILHPNHPQVRRMLELLQSEYVGLYGEPDPNPHGGVENAWYEGGEIIALFPDQTAGRAIAIAGWEKQVVDGEIVAVLKRMYVHYEHRGLGLSKKLLGSIEISAKKHGMSKLLLETGTVQTTAISLYTSCGYTPVNGFGWYAKSPDSVFLGKALS